MKYVFYVSAACFTFAPMLASAAAIPASKIGIYAELCGSGRVVFIPLSKDGENPDQPPHFTGACHAVCNDEQGEGSSESGD